VAIGGRVNAAARARALTGCEGAQYSDLMKAELNALDERIKSLIRLVDGLRAENADLRHNLAATESENEGLRRKVEGARDRLQNLLSRVPDPGS
jgi:cell division protein ZapB